MASELHVDAIKHSGGTSAMTIDSTGRILTPARPAFRARLGDATGSFGTQGTLVFETEDFDIGGNYDTSNGRFTAPIAGIYWFCFDSLTATDTSGTSNASGDTIQVTFEINGSAPAGGGVSYHYIAATNQTTITRVDLFQLSVNDYVTVNFTSEFAYSDNNPIYDPVFQGYLVG